MGNSNSSVKVKGIFDEVLNYEVKEQTGKDDEAGSISSSSSNPSVSEVKEASSSASGPTITSLAEKIESLFDFPIAEKELSTILPVSSIRKLRQFRTQVFALLLYTCIKEIHKMALLRPKINGVASSFLPQSTEGKYCPAAKMNLSAADITRFTTALLLLRHCMPVALEHECLLEDVISEEPKNAAGEKHSMKTTQKKSAFTETFRHSFFSLGSKCNEHNIEDCFPALCINPALAGETCASTGTVLVWSLVECCFIRGLTLPQQWKPLPSERDCLTNQKGASDSTVEVSPITFPSLTHNEVDLNLLWYEGVGSENPLKPKSKKGPVTEKSVRRMRSEILHTLLITLSSPLFRGSNQTATDIKSTPGSQEEAKTLRNQREARRDGAKGPSTHSVGCFADAFEHLEDALEGSQTPSHTGGLPSVSPSSVTRDPLFMEPLLFVSIVPLMPTLALSLLNALLGYRPFGVMPYSSYVASNEEKEIMMGTRVLVAVLLYAGVPIQLKSRADKASPSPRTTILVQDIANEATTSVQTEEGTTNEVSCTPGDAPREPSENISLQNPGFGDPGVPSDSGNNNAESKMCTPSPAASVKMVERKGSNSFFSSSFAGDRPGSPRPQKFVHCVRKLIYEITMTESKLIISNFRRIIGLRTYAGQTYLPDSQKKMESQDEFFFLLWKLIDISPMVYQQFAFHPDALSYIVPILEYALDVRKNLLDFAHHFQLGVFLLLRLSELRAFNLQCNKVLNETLPFSFPRISLGNTTYLEVLVIALCILIEIKDHRVLPALSSCSFALANMAPYLTSIGAATATRLAYTFGLICTRLLRLPSQSPFREKYESIMINICEAIASILQYNGGAGTKCLIAALIPYRLLISLIVEVFVRQRRYQLCNSNPSPFLIVTLDAALTAAAPLAAGAPTASLLTKPVAILPSSPNGGGPSSPSAVASPTTTIMDLMGRFVASSSGITFNSPQACRHAEPTPSLPGTNDDAPSQVGLAPSVPRDSEPTGNSESGLKDVNQKSSTDDNDTPSSPLASGSTVITNADIRRTEDLAQQLSHLNLVGALPTPHQIFVKRLKTSLEVEEWSVVIFWMGLYSCFPDGFHENHISDQVLKVESK